MSALPTVHLKKADTVAYLREVFRLEHKKYALEESRKDPQTDWNVLDSVPQSIPLNEGSAVSEEFARARRWIPLFNLIFLYGGAHLLNPLSRHLANQWNISEDTLSNCCIAGLLLGALIGSFLLWNLLPRAYARARLRKSREEHTKKQTEHSGCDVSQNIWPDVLSHQIDLTIQRINSALQQLYGYEILPAKYHTFHAVGYILLYLESGSAETLNNALNKYDDDMLHGAVCTQADEISFPHEITQSIIRENSFLVQNTFDEIRQLSLQNVDMIQYQRLATEKFKALQDSVKSTEFQQNIDMLERAAKK